MKQRGGGMPRKQREALYNAAIAYGNKQKALIRAKGILIKLDARIEFMMLSIQKNVNE